ncbi:hypothetical protein C8R44DRAFT_989482 [Mycena epipterygia]|nr:hypothetical protein C8R44DRAFT_989482 [Mycena epipterygia]
MKSSSHVETLVQYTKIAASTVQDIASSTTVPFLGPMGTLTLSILHCIESVKSNKDEWNQMVEDIHEIVTAVIHLYSQTETDGVLPPVVLYDMAKFTETLQKIYTFGAAKQGMGLIKKFFKQQDNAAGLAECQAALRHSLEIFRVRMGTSTSVGMAQMRKTAKQQHEELLALLAAHPELTNSDRSSSLTGTVPGMGDSTESVHLLPPSPQIFHGRESELEHVATILAQDSARVIILGPGGIGKTSLAAAALHQPDVLAKYSCRYFVPCHSSATCADLLSNIASHVGLEDGSNLGKKIARHFSHSPASLLVLDNFETAWEAATSHSEVETFLSLLTDIPQLALLITMRGAERPAKVKWSRPFLAPRYNISNSYLVCYTLVPLPDSAALKTFFEIADTDHEERYVRQLLAFTGNLPLAITLMANVAAYDGCESAISRWKAENTRLLSDGYDQRSSLDISIMLSFTSSRMTPEAQDLLAILSMLPDGLSDSDLTQYGLPIPNILTSKATLLRTSLAYLDNDRRLNVLVPVREHVRVVHPPSATLKSSMRQFIHKIIGLWDDFHTIISGYLVSHISQNLANINSLLLDGMRTDSPDLISTLHSILSLNDFLRTTNRGPCALICKMPEQLVHLRDHKIYGEYLIERLKASTVLPILESEDIIAQGDRYFQGADTLERARWCNSAAYYYCFQTTEMGKSLDSYNSALSLVESSGQINVEGRRALCGISFVLRRTGDMVGSQMHAQKAQEYAENLGDIYGQAFAISLQARCSRRQNRINDAAQLFQSARQLMETCGLADRVRRGSKDFASVARRAPGAQMTFPIVFSMLNIAYIDINTGVESNLILPNLNIPRDQLTTSLAYPIGVLFCDMGYAALQLRDGNVDAAKSLFVALLAKFNNVSDEGTTYCLERLANLETGMFGLEATLGWAGLYLVHSLRGKERIAITHALRCLGQIFVAQGDDETALSLFRVALDELTRMDVHWWRADCMVRIADIFERRTDVSKSVKLWKAARPLFERSLQTQCVALVDAELATVESL